jgi:hypothetical protein
MKPESGLTIRKGFRYREWVEPVIGSVRKQGSKPVGNSAEAFEGLKSGRRLPL